MCKKLPYDDFKWYYRRMDEKRVMKYSDDDDTGYILEVDLDYPKELHDLHKDFPLAPEVMSISESMLSQVQKDIHKYYYGLDPAYYITLPNYSWNAVLSLTGVRLQQIHKKEMYEMIEHGLRGGMTQSPLRR